MTSEYCCNCHCKPERDTESYTKEEIDIMFKNISDFLNLQRETTLICENEWRKALIQHLSFMPVDFRKKMVGGGSGFDYWKECIADLRTRFC